MQREYALTLERYRRLVLGTSPAPEDIIPIDLQPGSGKVQQLDVWYPGDTEMALFTYVFSLYTSCPSHNLCSVYSPAHFLAWTVFSSANWLYAFLLLGLISLQVRTDLLLLVLISNMADGRYIDSCPYVLL